MQRIPELGECPIPKPSSLVSAGRYPSTNPRQFFQGDAASGAFSDRYKLLRYAVIGMGLEPPLLSRKLLESALSTSSAAFLQAAPASCKVAANAVNGSASVSFSVASSGQGDDAKIKECRVTATPIPLPG